MRKSSLFAGAGVMAAVLFWAGNAVLARFVKDSIPPISLNFWRWATVLLLLSPWLYGALKQNSRLLLREWRFILLQSFLGVSVFNSCLYLAAHTTAAANISLINAMVPVVVLLVAWRLLGVPPRAQQLLGVGVAVLGLLIVVARGDPAKLFAFRFAWGDLWMLAAICSWGLYSVMLKKKSLPLPPFQFLAVTATLGTLLLLPAYLLESRQSDFVLSLQELPILLYLALFASIAAYYCWGEGIRVLGPTVTAIFGYLLPVFTAVLGLVLLGENLYWYQLVGGLLMFCGFYLGITTKEKLIYAEARGED